MQGRNSSALAGGELADDDFAAIREVLRERRCFDLGSYKDNCIRRRIARRIRHVGVGAPASYLELLRQSEDEVDSLLASLTIHVSQFFRNPDTFATLEGKVLPDIFRRAGSAVGKNVRLWSVGCASGEEPYSLALILAELAPGVPVSILGSDLSPKILEKAREGIYDPLRLTKVPPAMLSRHFIPEGSAFRLGDEIRSRVTFQRQNILADHPFPAADLILCRNVLIYFSRQEQEEILCRFAATLREGGWLVLGKAETLLGEARRLFTSEYPAERIYRRNQVRGDERRALTA